MNFGEEKCEYCQRSIGRQEQAYVLHGKTACEECDRTFRAENRWVGASEAEDSEHEVTLVTEIGAADAMLPPVETLSTTPRTVAVTAVSWVLIAGGIVSLVSMALANLLIQDRYVAGLAKYGPPGQFLNLLGWISGSTMLIVGRFMLKGVNRARWLFIIWNAIAIATGLVCFDSTRVLLPGIIFYVCITVVLFQSESRAFFKRGTCECFAQDPSVGRRPEDGAARTATSGAAQPTENGAPFVLRAVPKLVLVGSILVSAFLGGMAAGYYGYAKDISAGEPIVFWLWFVLLPVGALALAWWADKFFDWSSGVAFAAPISTLVGFWLVYRHPDVWVWSGAGSSAGTSVGLCLAALLLGRRLRLWRPQWTGWPRRLQGLTACVLLTGYSAIAAALLATPLDVEYEIHWLSHKGQGILNSGTTDDGVFSWETGSPTGGICDNAIPLDLILFAAENGWSGVTSNMTRNARKSCVGPLLRVLPIRDQSPLEYARKHDL